MIALGTRPEAIKLVPVVAALRACGGEVHVCATGQHGEMLDQALGAFGLRPDSILTLERSDPSLDRLAADVLTGVGEILDRVRPGRIIVQGDTTSALSTALAAAHRRIPIAHVEAGLRSGDRANPWPEENNRRAIGALADLHFAPTEAAVAALRREGIPEQSIALVGNTVIDALHLTGARIDEDPRLIAPIAPVLAAAGDRAVLLATAHRRESFAGGIAAIARAISRIAARGDVLAIVPTHPNPLVREPIEAILGGREDVVLLPPVDYPCFVHLLAKARLVLTDSGGVQEEAPALGTPVLVARAVTERGEGVAAGAAELVGVDEDTIVSAAARLLDGASDAVRPVPVSLYGDGRSAQRIAERLMR